jgi:maleylpyruvate isomerase
MITGARERYGFELLRNPSVGGDVVHDFDAAFDVKLELREVEDATARFTETIEKLDDEKLREPSLCPGWTRAHVATHVARNADSLVNLLTWARTGEELPQYASAEARNADIEAGSGRPRDEVLTDLRASAGRFADAVRSMPVAGWRVPVRWRSGVTRPAQAVLASRRREVEVHHVDLAAGYTPAHWDPGFVGELLGQVAGDFSGRPDVPALRLEATDVESGLDPDPTSTWRIDGEGSPQTIHGPRAALLAWLIGRSSGDGLVVPDGSLPTLPAWA